MRTSPLPDDDTTSVAPEKHREIYRIAIPTMITSSRALAGFVIAYLIIVHQADSWAFSLFIAAIATDLVDGYAARKLNGVSRLGLFLDPTADKLLAGWTWVALLVAGWAPWWLAGGMLARDILVGAGWIWAHTRQITWKPNRLGQLMVSFEGVALPVLLFRNSWLDVHWPTVGIILGSISLFLAMASWLQYILQGPQAVVPSPKPESI